MHTCTHARTPTERPVPVCLASRQLLNNNRIAKMPVILHRYPGSDFGVSSTKGNVIECQNVGSWWGLDVGDDSTTMRFGGPTYFRQDLQGCRCNPAHTAYVPGSVVRSNGTEGTMTCAPHVDPADDELKALVLRVQALEGRLAALALWQSPNGLLIVARESRRAVLTAMNLVRRRVDATPVTGRCLPNCAATSTLAGGTDTPAPTASTAVAAGSTTTPALTNSTAAAVAGSTTAPASTASTAAAAVADSTTTPDTPDTPDTPATPDTPDTPTSAASTASTAAAAGSPNIPAPTDGTVAATAPSTTTPATSDSTATAAVAVLTPDPAAATGTGAATTVTAVETTTVTSTTMTTTTRVVDCAYTVSACTTQCEAGSLRTLAVTRQPKSSGAPCPALLPDCRPGEGACPAPTTTARNTTMVTPVPGQTSSVATGGANNASNVSSGSSTSPTTAGPIIHGHVRIVIEAGKCLPAHASTRAAELPFQPRHYCRPDPPCIHLPMRRGTVCPHGC